MMDIISLFIKAGEKRKYAYFIRTNVIYSFNKVYFFSKFNCEYINSHTIISLCI